MSSDFITDFKNIVNRTDCGLRITYNPHRFAYKGVKFFYKGVRDYLESNFRCGSEEISDEEFNIEILNSFIDPKDYNMCLRHNVLWEAIWSKHGEFDMYQVYGSSFEKIILIMSNIDD